MNTDQKTVLVLRTSDKDGKAHGGFQWPTSGMVECPDWKPTSDCGNGLHGIVWPEGDWSSIKNYDDEIWQVVKVLESDIIKIDGKVKFPKGEVVYSGNMAIAFTMVAKEWTKSIPEFIAETSKEAKEGHSTRNASSGHSTRNASSGHYTRNASSGHSTRNASSGHSTQNASSGDYTRNASSGDSTQNASSGDSTRNASSGDSTRNASSGHSTRNASSGHSTRNASSGDYTRNASSGDYTRHDHSGKNSITACSGSVEKFRIGENGCITVPYHDGNRTRFAIGYAGENIEVGKWYKVDGTGNFIEITE